MIDSLKSIQQRLAEIGEVRAKLDEEEHDLNIAERVLVRLEAMNKTGFRPVLPRGISDGASTSTKRPPSQTKIIVATLKSSAQPWFESTNNLREAIRVIHGVQMRKSSFNPLMSQLVKEGIVVRDDLKVALAERVKGGAETNQAAE
ncbi:MAG: hypothetical protein IH905_16660 [Proteobacteria bacterium]|nr:hypothetical protein [Pseudomonadota bacterium]